RDHDPLEPFRDVVGERLELGRTQRVVPHHADGGAGRLEGLDEVEREAVVVVDHEDHGSDPPTPAPASSSAATGRSPFVVDPPASSAASSIARRRAAALCSVSSNSRSGTEPATMPAPVWTCA